MSSSHLFLGLPTVLLALYLLLKPGYHFAAFFDILVSGSGKGYWLSSSHRLLAPHRCLSSFLRCFSSFCSCLFVLSG